MKLFLLVSMVVMGSLSFASDNSPIKESNTTSEPLSGNNISLEEKTSNRNKVLDSYLEFRRTSERGSRRTDS